MFGSIEEVALEFKRQKYICSSEIATAIYLSERMQKPILVEGPAGVGKTSLASVWASAAGFELIRMQCYEGLDEGKALYEWEYAKQLLYTQILKEKIQDVLSGCEDLRQAVERIDRQEDAFFSEKFLLPRPLLKAILSERQVVLLIDEVDKADPEFEAFLLEVLSDFQVSVPELGTLMARHIPHVILTSNNAREMSDALKRRCLHLFIDFPTADHEKEIIELKVPGIAERLARQVIDVVHKVRKVDLKKLPSISETLDWARALTILNIDTLDAETVKSTLNLFLKYEGDIKKVKENLHSLLPASDGKLN
ncbi:MAG: MoxR family ATPase [Candidatus Abyssobacteria bacterium SURF_17]|uniref:MoxR family ATPase n=1 Tax=Candidatus Abyssobacteria bacterium SURF_17 TaxID=2093361 RepID=A0A419EZL1_9BACT|nr:MAG: MoxR family ATPase [Candidatus Abyssubacteria bacterium SURF_17]